MISKSMNWVDAMLNKLSGIHNKKLKQIVRYSQLQREHQISPGDFPDIAKMQEVLVRLDSGHFDSVDTWWRTYEEYIWHLLEKMWK